MSLVAWYPLNNTNNDINCINKGLDGINLNTMGTINYDNGKIGTAPIFNGDSSKCFYRDSFLYEKDFSWSVWFKITGNTGNALQFILSEGRDYEHFGCNLVYYNDNNLYLYYGMKHPNILFISNIELNRWYNIVITYGEPNINVYLNGNLVSSTQYIKPDYTCAEKFVIGKMSYSYANTSYFFPFNGLINDVRVYDHILSVKEIKEISKGLVLHYTLNGDILEDGIIYDSSGYGNNGIRYGLLTEDNNSAKYNMSLLFNDSNNNSIKTPFYELTRDECFTVNVWFYKTKLSNKAYDTIFGGPSGFEIETRDRDQTNPVIVLWNWGKGQIPYEFNKWNMLTMTRNSTEAKFYLNGELKFTTDPGTIPQGDYFIGAWNTYSQQNFYGNLSDFRIYATVLSDEDIKKLYNVQTSVDNEGNVYSYEFNDSSSNMKISKKGIFNHEDFEEREENKFKSYSDHLRCNTINEI